LIIWLVAYFLLGHPVFVSVDLPNALSALVPCEKMF